ncbi:MAG: signal peptidase I [Nitrospirota bacterium]|nr:signal peptidase I [Nitrospirota bacterium]
MSASPDTENPASRWKPRSAWVAGFLSFFFVGVGHVYVGRGRTGLFLMLVPPAVLLAAMWTLVALDGPLIPVVFGYFVLSVAVWLGQMVWAVRIALREGEEYCIGPWNRPAVYLGVILLSVTASMAQSLGEAQGVPPYRVSSGSMLPALEIGDHVLVVRFTERDTHPQRGDVIIFAYPEDRTKAFIKRVIGMPGDTLEIREKVVYLNGEPYRIPQEQHLDPRTLSADQNPRDFMSMVRVPEGHYFVMGDNRDHALDSRFWGFLPHEDVRGRARVIHWSLGPNGVRWDRVGMAVE